MIVGIACVVIFLVTACAGEIIGLVIESHNKRRWRTASYSIGFGFDAQRRRWPSLSRILLPSVIAPGTEESIFSYGESLKGLSGDVGGFRSPDHRFRGMGLLLPLPARVSRGPLRDKGRPYSCTRSNQVGEMVQLPGGRVS